MVADLVLEQKASDFPALQKIKTYFFLLVLVLLLPLSSDLASPDRTRILVFLILVLLVVVISSASSSAYPDADDPGGGSCDSVVKIVGRGVFRVSLGGGGPEEPDLVQQHPGLGLGVVLGVFGGVFLLFVFESYHRGPVVVVHRGAGHLAEGGGGGSGVAVL